MVCWWPTVSIERGVNFNSCTMMSSARWPLQRSVCTSACTWKREQRKRCYRGEPQKAKAGNFWRHQNVSVGDPQAGLFAPS